MSTAHYLTRQFIPLSKNWALKLIFMIRQKNYILFTSTMDPTSEFWNVIGKKSNPFIIFKVV